MPVNDQDLLRAALADLTVEQPAAPVDRLGGVRRRHARRRTAQLTAAVAAVAVAVAATVVGVGHLGSNAVQPAHRSVPGWALPWTDHRDGSVPQPVLDRAVQAWTVNDAAGETKVPQAPTPQPIWYVGQRVAGGDVVAVVFEVQSAIGPRLVAGWATASSVLAGQPAYRHGQSPWVLYDVAAPPAGYRGVLGLHVHGETAPDSAPPGSFPDDWVVLLTRPDAVSAYVGGAGTHGLDDGYAAFDAGQLDFGPLEVSARLRDGSYVGGVVGVPGAPDSRVPQLAAVPALVGVPTTPRSLGEAAGQGDSVTVASSLRATGVPTVFARCRGGRPIRVTVDTDASRPAVTIPCDDIQHVVHGPRLRAHGPYAPGHELMVHAGPFTPYRVAVLAPPRHGSSS